MIKYYKVIKCLHYNPRRSHGDDLVLPPALLRPEHHHVGGQAGRGAGPDEARVLGEIFLQSEY